MNKNFRSISTSAILIASIMLIAGAMSAASPIDVVSARRSGLQPSDKTAVAKGTIENHGVAAGVVAAPLSPRKNRSSSQIEPHVYAGGTTGSTALLSASGSGHGLVFTENKGQIVDTDGKLRPDVLYSAHSKGVEVFARRTGLSYVFSRKDSALDATTNDGSEISDQSQSSFTTYRLDMEFLGANPSPEIVSEDRSEDYANFYYAHCPKGITNVHSFRRVAYRNVYPEIDFILYQNDKGLKYDFVVKPGGKVGDIRIAYLGAKTIEIASIGSLLLTTPLGTIDEYAPVCFQELSSKTIVPSRFLLRNNVIGFEVGSYNEDEPLLIDPSVLWSTFYGGGSDEVAVSGGSDGSGNVLLAGWTVSSNFPTYSGIQNSQPGGYDGFAVKLSSTGSRVWATYVGGTSDDMSGGITADASGNIYITGTTASSNIPISNAFQAALGGGRDIYIAKLDASGSLQWATYYGGTDFDAGYRSTVDTDGKLLVVGETESSNMPVLNAFQSSLGGSKDAFIIKMNSSGQRVWATFYGGSGQDRGLAVAIDSSNAVLVTGGTSGNFPTSNAAQNSYGGGSYDAFVLKLTSAGSRSWATYYGGSNTESDWYSHGTYPIGFNSAGVSADVNGNVVIVGYTSSTDLPLSNAYQSAKAGGEDGFIAKYNSTGALQWSTYYGGSANDRIEDVIYDQNQGVFITGYTLSTNFPTNNPLQSSNAGGLDVIVARLNQSGTPTWSTYFGGSANNDCGMSITKWRSSLSVIGFTNSSNYPVTSGAFQTSFGGNSDPIVTTFTVCSAYTPSITASGPLSFCQGGSVTLTAEAGYTSYLWSTNATTQSIVVSQGSTYTVTTTDQGGCPGTSSDMVVTVYSNPVAHAGQDETTCAGVGVLIGEVATGGTAPYTYLWSPSSGLNSTSFVQPTASPTSTTTYSVVVTDANGCVSTDDVVVTVNPSPIANAGADAAVCNGTSTTIGQVATGGTSPYTYVWTPTTGLSSSTIAQPTANPTSTTTYTVTVTDANGCSGTDAVVVTVNPNPAANAGTDVAICNGIATTIGQVATGGSSPYTYAWTPTAGLSSSTIAQPTANPTATTTYSVTVTDANGCSGTDDVLVTVNTLPSVDAGTDATICNGANQVIGNTATGGTAPYTYSWSPTTGLSAANIAQPTAAPSSTTTYTVTVTDANGCTGTDAVVITVNPTPVAHAGADVAICQGSNSIIGDIATGGTAPYTYAWSPSTGLSSTSIAQPSANPASTTTYTVTVTDANGCTSTDDVAVTVNALPVAHAGADVAVCNGSGTTVGSVATGGTSPYTYAWTPSSGLSATDVAQPTASPASTTTYTVTATDANGCASTDDVVVTVHPVPTAHAGPDVGIVPNGSIVIGDTATGGSYPFTYAWSPATGLSSTTIAQPTASPANSTTYTVTVTDANGCISTDDALVTVWQNPVVDAGAGITICEGGSGTIGNTATGGTPPYSYAWTPATGLSATDVAQPSASPAASTRYYVTVTDAHNLTGTDSVDVTVERYNLMFEEVANCGSTYDVKVKINTCSSFRNGGANYSFNYNTACLSNPVLLTSHNFSGGYYDAMTLTNPLSGVLSINVDFIGSQGNGTQVALSPAWTDVATIRFTVASNAATTNFSFRGTSLTQSPTVQFDDNNTLLAAGTFSTLNAGIHGSPVANAGIDKAICLGSSTSIGETATGGTSPYSYSWSPSTGLSATNIAQPTASPSVQTDYIVLVTDNNGCTSLDTMVVSIHPQPAANAGSDVAICSGTSTVIGQAATGGTAPYTYAWSPTTGLNATDIAQPTAGPTSTTTYSVTVTDANGCTSADAVVVTVNALPVANAGADKAICGGGSVIIGEVATGGTSPYTYAWAPSTGLSATDVAQPTASPATATTYTVTVTDANGCSHSDVVDVSIHPQPTAHAGVDKSICPGGSTAIGDVATGGTSPYTYAWSPSTGLSAANVAQPTASPANATTYTITVTDANGCVSTDDVLVSINSVPIANAGSDKLIAPGGSVQIGELASGGVSPYTYSWSPSSGLSATNIAQPTASPSATTTYTVTVTDSNGCTGGDQVRVKVLEYNLAFAEVANCGSTYDVKVKLNGSAGFGNGGGNLVFSYNTAQLSSPTLQTAHNFTSGNYNAMTLTTPSSGTVSLNVDYTGTSGNGSAVAATPSWTDVATIRFTVVDTAGTTNFAFHTTNATQAPTIQYDDDFDALPGGAFGIHDVQIHSPLLANAGADVAICPSTSTQIGAVATGGYGPYVYSWSPGTGLSASNVAQPTATPASTTTYTLSITDANGCTASDDVVVTIYTPPIANAGADQSIWIGDTISIGQLATSGTPPYTYAWSPSTFLSDATVAQPNAWPDDTTTYTVTVTDAHGCVSSDAVLIEATPRPLLAKVKVWLHGPYNTSTSLMNTSLNSVGHLASFATGQPYGGAPWNYAGSEAVTGAFFGSNPDIVDWVLMEIRSGTAASTRVAQRAVFLLKDGSVVDLNGSDPVAFQLIPDGSYYIAIFHRNHLAIMSPSAVALSKTAPSTGYSHDFTTAQSQAYGYNPMKQLASGVFGLIAGDGNSDGNVNIVDKNSYWRLQNGTQYNYLTKKADYNLDGNINIVDRNTYWRVNNGTTSQVP